MKLLNFRRDVPPVPPHATLPPRERALIGHHPKGMNRTNQLSLSTEGDFPVQNGRANFSLSVTATFTPDCSPPMTVSFTDITVTDTTNGISTDP